MKMTGATENTVKNVGERTSRQIESAIGLAQEVQRLSAKILEQVQFVGTGQECLLASIAVRCDRIHQAILVLSQHRLAQPAGVCLRSLIEKRWVFLALVRPATQSEAFNELLSNHYFSQSQALKGLKQVAPEDRHSSITEDHLERVLKEIGTGWRRASARNWAERAGLLVEYQTVYALLCSQVHPSVVAAASHLLKERGAVAAITGLPDAESIPRNQVHACGVMLDILQNLPDGWANDAALVHARALRTKTESFWNTLHDDSVEIEARTS